MVTPQDFNQEEYNQVLRESYEQALQALGDFRQKIETFIQEFDPIELLGRISLLMHFDLQSPNELGLRLREMPILYFLVTIYLRKTDFGSRIPSYQDVEEIIDLTEHYFNSYQQCQIFREASSQNEYEKDKLVFSARNQKIIGYSNPNAYPFQMLDQIKGIFGNLDDYFVDVVGFTAADALNFGVKIISRYERVINEEALDPETYVRELLVFEPQDFSEAEHPEDTDKFRRYLDTFSCKFGDQREYRDILEESIISTNPIVKIGEKYFAPLLNYLVFNVPVIFEKILDNEKNNQTRLWQKFREEKSEYTESRTHEYLCRIFPKEKAFRNLRYFFDKTECEVDLLIIFDNKVLIVESKAARMTLPAKRGGISRLEADLKKTMEDAFSQAKQTKDYILAANNVIFTDKKGNIVLELRGDANVLDIFLVNVTLEPLMGFAIQPKELQSLGLFKTGHDVWSINLLELDILTKHISFPTVFIHYLQQRLSMQNDGLIHALDELTLFAYYLEMGKLAINNVDNNREPNFIILDGWVDSFDDLYLGGKESPQLKVEPEILEIIAFLESRRPFQGYSSVICALLDFNRATQQSISKHIAELTHKAEVDEGRHDFTIISQSVGIGFTFMCQSGTEDLTQRLDAYCNLKKYQTKAKRWVGIATSTVGKMPQIIEVIYADFPWEYDAQLDELVKKLL